MATDLATAYIQLVPSAQGISAGIEKELSAASGSAAKSAGSQIGSVLKTSAVAAISTVTTAATAMTTAFVKSAASTASYGDNIDKMSQKMGLSAEAYQEWDAIMQHCGTSITAMQPSMKTLAVAAETGSEAFTQLGISQSEIANMSQEELFSATIAALQNVEGETERTYLASKLLGKGATELGALLNTSAEDTEAMRQRVHELGGVMSNEAVAASAAYQDSLQDMQTAFQGISRNMVAEFLPAITSVMDGLTEMFAGNSDAGIALVTAGISDFIAQMTEAIPQVITLGSQLVTSLLTAIIENLPALMNAGTDAILSLCNGLAAAIPTLIPMAAQAIKSIVVGLLDNIPALIAAALSLIQGLADGLLAAIPVLIGAIPQIITSLITAILASIPQIIQAGINLLTSLVTALPQIIQTVVAAIPQIINGVVTSVIGSIPRIVQAGIQLFISLIQALPQIIATIIPAVPQIVGSIVNALVSNIPQIIQAGVQLLTALITNLPTIIATIVGSMPQIISGIVSALSQGVSQLVQVGANLVKGLWQGIQSLASWLWSQVSGWISGIWSGIKNFFGIHSPSTEMAWAGEMLARGLAGGINDNADRAVTATEKMAARVAGVDFGIDAGGIRSAVDTITKDAAGVVRADVAAAASGGLQESAAADVLAQILQALLALSDKIDRLQIVLNTGALVGGLLDPMNEAMGARSALEARGVG